MRKLEPTFSAKRTPWFVPAFTLIESLIVILVISILASLLIPTLQRAQGASRSVVCKSNLHQIGIGLRLYVDEFEEYPPNANYILLPYCGSNPRLFYCPSEPSQYCNESWANPALDYQGSTSYAYNGYGTGSATTSLGLTPSPLATNTLVSESLVLVPGDMLAIGDQWNYNWILGFGWPGQPVERAIGRKDHHANAVFCDGHVEASNSESIPTITDPNWGVNFKPRAEHAKRWNKDNQPHQETWPP